MSKQCTLPVTIHCSVLQYKTLNSSSCLSHDTLSLLLPNASSQLLVTIHCCVLRYNPPLAKLLCYNTTLCIVTQLFFFFPAKPTLSLSQYNGVYCDTLLQPKPLLSQYTWCIMIHSPYNPLPHVAIQFPAKLPTLSQYNGCIVTHSTAYFTPKTCCVTIQFPIVL